MMLRWEYVKKWRLNRLLFRPRVVWLCALLTVVAARCSMFAQQQVKPQPGDQKIEAAGYLLQADREMTCSPESSLLWAKKAFDTASGDKEKLDHAMVEQLKSQSNIKIAAATNRIAQFNEVTRQAEDLIKQARLETAPGALDELDPEGCYTGFKALRYKLDQRKAAAGELIRKGDLVLATRRKDPIAYHKAKEAHDVNWALLLYSKARRIDAEYPGLDARIAEAKQISRQISKRKRAS